jgi:6-phosphogluconolactonase (cycloisomerase 2 family)
MATRLISPLHPLVVCPRFPLQRRQAFSLLLLLFLLLLAVPITSAQSPQQFVYSSSQTNSAVNGSAKNPLTGTLSALSTSPFPSRSTGGPMAIDPLGRFLFIANSATSTISMFQIDSNSGALTEVPTSPFAIGFTLTSSSQPSNPQSLATEKSGQFLYVGYENGSIPGMGELDEFVIDAVHLQLLPATNTAGSNFLSTSSGPIALVSDPQGRALYSYLGFKTQSGLENAELDSYSIDSASGNLNFLNMGDGGEQARTMAIDPQDRFLFIGHGQLEGQFSGIQLSPLDGSFGTENSTLSLGPALFPQFMVVDSSGQYLYVGTNMAIHIFSIDSVTGALTEVQNSPFPKNLAVAAVTDPMGPFLYTVDDSGVHGFQIDLQTGLLNELLGSPFPGSGATLAISGAPVQAVSGPVATLFPATAAFGNVVDNSPSSTQVIEIVSNGSQALSISAIGFSGANPADFTQTNTCQPPTVLNPEKSCSVSITFTPAAAGMRQAMLIVSDNAPGSPQSAALTGTGLTPASGITLAPASLTFASITQGTTSATQTISLTSSGNVPLNISSIVLSGPNPSDFTITPNGCTKLNVASACTINVTFTPLAAGGRSATISISDDAPGSPQSIALNGNATAAFMVSPTQSGSMTATVTAGQTAQYNLQITPGPSYSGTISMTCTGAPTGASCQVSPSMVPVSGGAAAPFMVLVSTSGAAGTLPSWKAPRLRWLPLLLSLPSLILLLIFFTRFINNVKQASTLSKRRLALCSAISLLLVFAAVGFAGCGGGSMSAPPPIVTPQGTTMLTVTPSAASTSGQPLQLPSIQLTLTVK